MYAKNVQNIVFDALDKQGNFKWTYEDEIVDGAMICHEGEVHHPKVRELLELPPLKKADDSTEQDPGAQATGNGPEAEKKPEEPKAEEKSVDKPAEEKSESSEEEKKE